MLPRPAIDSSFFLFQSFLVLRQPYSKLEHQNTTLLEQQASIFLLVISFLHKVWSSLRHSDDKLSIQFTVSRTLASINLLQKSSLLWHNFCLLELLPRIVLPSTTLETVAQQCKNCLLILDCNTCKFIFAILWSINLRHQHATTPALPYVSFLSTQASLSLIPILDVE